MTEENSKGRGKKFLIWALTSPVTFILGVLMLYYAVQAYVIGNQPWFNKMMMAGIAAIWILWLVFKNLIKFLLLLVVGGVLFYGYYRLENRDEIACKEQGRVWYKETKTCEDKLDWTEKLEKLWHEYIAKEKPAAEEKTIEKNEKETAK